MTNINFDEPSVGQVAAANKPALKVTNTGTNTIGIMGEAAQGWGVHGKSDKYSGVVGQSKQFTGIYGTGPNGGYFEGDVVGVSGHSVEGWGVYGLADKYSGVVGQSKQFTGVYGTGPNGGYFEGDVVGVSGHSVEGWGVYGLADKYSGVVGQSKQFTGIYGTGPFGGYFDGNVQVNGWVQVTQDIVLLNADCAEDFDIVEENVEPGTVMVLTDNGSLQQSHQEYDKKVAGIVSGASGYKPAIVLDSQHSQNQYGKDQNNNKNRPRLPIALMGKVYCKVDAKHSSIEIGDLLTTSSTKGYAMKAEDPMKAFGSIIGKALGSIKEGVGMIPVLVALQ